MIYATGDVTVTAKRIPFLHRRPVFPSSTETSGPQRHRTGDDVASLGLRSRMLYHDGAVRAERQRHAEQVHHALSVDWLGQTCDCAGFD